LKIIILITLLLKNRKQFQTIGDKTMPNPVLFEIDNSTALITLNRPKRRNAINQALLTALYDALDEVRSSEKIRAAIITGAGKSFCSGLDLEAFPSENIFDPRGDGLDFPDVINACRKPIIGAINGHAVTGGLEIALQCDFLIASERASFADTHARVGIHPGWGMTQLLQEAVGIRRAKQMSFTCQFVDAESAFNWGLVNEVVPHERLLPRTKQIADAISDTDRPMLETIKALMESRRNATLKQALEGERQGFENFARERDLIG